jgi:hypothetical protein
MSQNEERKDLTHARIRCSNKVTIKSEMRILVI